MTTAPFVMLARRMSAQETRDYLAAAGWIKPTGGWGRDSWYPPEAAEVMAGRMEHLPAGRATSYTTRAALLTALREAQEAADTAAGAGASSTR